MFTGLVQELGKLLDKRPLEAGVRLRIQSTLGSKSRYVLGESIAIDGACLSVVAWDGAAFEVEASVETLNRTTLKNARVGEALHLERAARFGDSIGGHMVTGHVDGLATLLRRDMLGDRKSTRLNSSHRL